MKHRLAVLASHPISYQAPLWRLLSADPEIELAVFFEKDTGVKPHYDREFGAVIQWDVPLLEGYSFGFIKNYLSFLGELRARRFDAILLHAWNSPLTWLAAGWATIIGTKVLLRAESPWSHERGKPAWKRAAKKVLLGGILFRLVSAFCYIGEQNKLFYLAYGVPSHKLFFAPYAVENDRFDRARAALPAKEELRRHIGLPPDAVVFLSVAKLIQKKRPLDILAAYRELPLPENGKALILVGEGSLRPVLEDYISGHNLKNVFLPGFVGQQDIPRYYAAADILVLPSGIGETWGLVVNEALCFGLPAVVSDMVGSASDLVQDGGNGFIVPAGDIKALAKALEKLAADAEQRAAFGRKSLGLVKGYSYEADAKGIKAALQYLRS